MGNLALRIDGIGKRYRIGSEVVRSESLSQSVVNALKSPFQNLKFLRSLSQFDDDEGDDVFWALRDVSFDVAHGDVVGLIGRNGAGKSTLLKVLSRITEPTKGRIDVYGRIASLLEVGTGFNDELTGRENTYLNGAILGMSKAEVDRKFDEIVDFSGIGKFIDTPVKRYSSGMKVRLGFAVAAHLEPEILLVDEVLAVGDVAFQKKCLGKMDSVAGEGRTVIFVSHHMSMIQALCRRGILLDAGGVVLDGDVDDAVSAYMTLAEESSEETPLASRTDRVGSGAVRFRSVDFLDPFTRDPIKQMISGEPILLRIRLHSEMRQEGITVGLSFYASESGALMTAVRSDAVDQSYTVEPGETDIYCLVDRWPLKHGRYFFNVNAKHRGVVADGVKEAAFFDVEEGDFYGCGVIPARGRPGVLVDFNWQDEGQHVAAFVRAESV